MSRGQQTFKQSDVTKALRAAVKAGITVARYEIDKNGKIVVVTGRGPEEPISDGKEENEWDSV
jgi:hypothetical protein